MSRVCRLFDKTMTSATSWGPNLQSVNPRSSEGVCAVCGNSLKSLGFFLDWQIAACGGCGFGRLVDTPADGRGEEAFADYFAKGGAKIRRARRRLGRILRAIDRAPASVAMLDAGCHAGFAVEAAVDLGLAATGIDPSVRAVEAGLARRPDLDLRVGRVEDAVLPEAAFDLVYCSEAIEHAPDPHAFMGALARALKPGGVLYLTTPDFGHPLRPRDLGRWQAYDPPRHICYFTRQSLRLLLAAHGFAPPRFALAFKTGIKLLARKGPGR